MSPRAAYRRIHRAVGPGSATWGAKKLLLGLLALGLMTLGSTGTYAVQNAEDANGGATVATGTLTLSDTVGTGSACFSYGTGSANNANGGCSPVILESSGLAYPGGTPLTAKVTIANNGSIAGSDLSVYMPSCTQTTTTGYSGGTNASGNPCGLNGAQFYLEETTADGTPTACWWVSGTNGACNWTASSLYAFKLSHYNANNALDLGPGPAAGGSRYFVVGMQLPSNASTNFMGQAASFALTWHLTTF